MYMEQKLLEDLNNEDVSHFNYEAKNGDELVIFLDDHSFAFEYKDGKFRVAPDDYSIYASAQCAGRNRSYRKS